MKSLEILKIDPDSLMSPGYPSEVEQLRRRVSELEDQLRSRSGQQRTIPPEWSSIPGVGTWTYHLGEPAILGSHEFFRICGLPYLSNGWILLEDLAGLIHPLDREWALSDHRRYLSGELPYSGALRIVRRNDSAIRWILVCGSVLDSGEIPYGVAGTIYDVTDVQETEQALRIVEQRFRAVAQSSHQMIYTIDKQGSSDKGSLFWQNLTGQSAAAAANWGWLSALHPEDRDRVRMEWKNAAEQLTPFYSEYRVLTSSGTEVYAGVRAIPLFEDNGELREWVVGFTDITERKAAAQALRDSEQKLLRTTEQFNLAALALGALIYDWDTASDVVDRVRGLPELVGYAPDEVPATSVWWRQQVHPDDLGTLPATGQYNRDVHGQVKVNEYRVRHKRGHYVWVRDFSVQLIGDRGINRVVGCTVDISPYKRAEEELHRHADALARSNAELQQFAYAASHDLQEPLRSVSIYTDLLRRRYRDSIDDQANQYIDFAVEGARRMESLLQGLLAYSRIGNVKDPVAVDTNAVLDKVLFNLAERIRESGAQVESVALPTVYADEVHVLQLFQNVLGNALKYCSNVAPRVRISARSLGHFIEFCISDNGIGIAPEHHAQIFAIFRRLHASGYEGTGIGLAICDRIVKSYGGSIRVESDGDGTGSKFYFLLPGRAANS